VAQPASREPIPLDPASRLKPPLLDDEDEPPPLLLPEPDPELEPELDPDELPDGWSNPDDVAFEPHAATRNNPNAMEVRLDARDHLPMDRSLYRSPMARRDAVRDGKRRSDARGT